jgi:hypothetical protein
MTKNREKKNFTKSGKVVPPGAPVGFDLVVGFPLRRGNVGQ